MGTGPLISPRIGLKRKLGRFRDLLKVVSAYDDDDGDKDLLHGWIWKCEDESRKSHNLDAAQIFKYYGGLLMKLGCNVMNEPIMKDFYLEMLKAETFQAAQSLKIMLDKLLPYRAERIVNCFKNKNDSAPFETICLYDYDPTVVLFKNLHWKDAHFQIDVNVHPAKYSFCFRDISDNEKEIAKDHAEFVLKQMNCFHEYTCEDHMFRLTKRFDFPSQEEELIAYIRAFNKKLSEVVASTESMTN